MAGKRKWRYALATAVLMAATALIIWGCEQRAHRSGEAEDTTTVSERVELDYYIWDDELLYTRRVVEAFNAMWPNIHVNVRVLKNDIYDEEIKEKIAAGENVDLMGIRGVSRIMDYQENGLLLDITDYLHASNLDMTAYGNMVYSYTIGDRYYGLPTRSTYWALYYNKELFDQAGIAYPQTMTWEEYAQLAKRLTNDKEGDEKVWGGYFADWIYNFAGVQRQNYLYDDDITEMMESLLWLNRFYNEDQSHMPLADVIEIADDYIKVFESGKAAMMPQGEWAAGRLCMDEEAGLSDVDWDIAPMPVFDKQEKHRTWGQYQFAGITSDCEHPEAAFEFLSYLCGNEGAKIYASTGMISAYMDEEVLDVYRKNMQGIDVDVFFQSQRILECPPIPEYNKLEWAYNEISESYLLGEITYEEAWEQMEEKRREIYTDGGE